MTADSLRPTASTRAARSDTLILLLPAAGGVYVLAWVLGLVLGPSAPDPSAAATEIQVYYVTQTGGIVLQSLLVHGLAGLALVVLALGFGRALSPAGPEARWVRAAGLTAALVSFVQVALALAACSIADTAAPATSAALFSAINDADTLKLILLAAFAVSVGYVGTRAAVVPGWLRLLGYLLAPLLVVGGLAFAIDSSVLYVVLEVSLVVLLAWAATASWVIARHRTG